MSSLPARLRPLWPVFKRAHRFLTLIIGVGHRMLSLALGSRGVPRSAYMSSAEAARAEGEQIVRTAGGAAYRMDRKIPWGEPSRHRAYLDGQQIDVPERYVLEVERGCVAGDYGALITPGGRLEYESSPYFRITGWREHPLYLRPTLGERQYVPGRVLSLMAPGTATNYYHFLYDAIGRLGVIEECGVETAIDAVVVPHRARYQRELLEMAGVTAPLISLDRGQCVTADTLVVPSIPNSAVIAPKGTVSWLRARLLPEDRHTMSERIYITRGQAKGTRRYLQEEDLWPQLEERGFLRVDPGSLTVREQIALFARAQMVVSPHGAGLSNITFAQPGVQVLEFFAPSYVHLGLWGICEAIGDVRYRYLVGEGPTLPRHLPRPFDDISLEPRRLVKVIDLMIAEIEAAGHGTMSTHRRRDDKE